MGILLCEQNFRDVWRRNKSVMGEIGKILRTHKHTHAAKLVVRLSVVQVFIGQQRDLLPIKRRRSQPSRKCAGHPAFCLISRIFSRTSHISGFILK